MRINLYGGPGSGKSTMAAWLFSQAKRHGFSVEHVGEYVKSWATANRKVHEFDQVYLFGKQTQYEYRWLNNGVKNIITDSPTLLGPIYTEHYFGEELADPLYTLCELYDVAHPEINIFLERNDKPYDPNGRYQTEEQAKAVDMLIRDKLAEYGKLVHYVDWNDEKLLLDIILSSLDK